MSQIKLRRVDIFPDPHQSLCLCCILKIMDKDGGKHLQAPLYSLAHLVRFRNVGEFRSLLLPGLPGSGWCL